MRYPVNYVAEDAGGYTCYLPGLDGETGWVTQGETMEEARAMAQECLDSYLLSCADLGKEPEAPLAIEVGGECVYASPRIATAYAIRGLRKKAALSQVQAAKAIGVSQALYSKWEDPDKCNATLETLDKIGKAFGCRLEVVFACG